MATLVIMPRQGQSVESCVITTWNKKVGDKVNVGDILFSYETDKSSFDETAETEGVLLKTFAEDGDDVPCLDPVCVIGEAGEDISGLLPESSGDADKTEQAEPVKIVEQMILTAAVSTADSSDGKLKISPRAKNLAAKTDADITLAIPTGPHGRIIERDVNALLDKGLTVKTPIAPAAAEVAETRPIAENVYTDVKLTNMRKVIAKSMHTSLSNMAQLTLNSSFDATQVNNYRNSVKQHSEALGLANITLNDMVVYAVSRTLKAHKDLNAHYLEEADTMRYFNDVHIGVAVDTDRGLMVPTLFNADKMTLNEISKELKIIIKEAQVGTINPDKLKGATFTITNLGSLGVESFTPVINPPQTGILGVDTLTRRVREVNGQDVFYTAMGLSLTFDHRALDGAPAAKFLKDLCGNLENFNLLLAK